MRLRSLLLGLAAFALALIVLMPARWFAGALPAGVTCAALRGSVWRGGCDGLAYEPAGRSPLRIETLRWRLSPSGLLRAALALDFTATFEQGDARGHVELRRGGRLALSGLSARALLDRRLLGALPPDWRGQIEIDSGQIAVRGETIEQLAGNASVRELVNAAGVQLGSYRISFPPSGPAPFTGALQDQGGPVELAATVAIAADRHWSLDGTVLARGDAGPGLDRHLMLLGPADGAGRRRISASGTFR